MPGSITQLNNEQNKNSIDEGLREECLFLTQTPGPEYYGIVDRPIRYDSILRRVSIYSQSEHF